MMIDVVNYSTDVHHEQNLHPCELWNHVSFNLYSHPMYTLKIRCIITPKAFNWAMITNQQMRYALKKFAYSTMMQSCFLCCVTKVLILLHKYLLETKIYDTYKNDWLYDNVIIIKNLMHLCCIYFMYQLFCRLHYN